MIKRIATLLLAGAFMTTGVVGCGSTHGEKMREEAHGRVNLMRAQLYYDQAMQAFSTGQLEKAMREINTAIAMYDDAPGYYVLQGRIHLEGHRLEQALRSLETALETDDLNAEAHYYAGIIHQRWSQHEDAATRYLRASELDEANVQYLLAAAEALIANKQYAEARRLVQNRVAYFEHNAALHQLMGHIHLLEDQPIDAVPYFDQARLLKPDDLQLVEELARSQFEAKLYGRCYRTIRELQQRVTEERPDLVHLEARCLTMMGRGVDARNTYLKLTRLTPNDPAAWIELGNVAYELGDFSRVAMCGSRAVSLAPERFEGHLLTGLFERNRGKVAEAIKHFEQAAELTDRSAWPLIMLGVTMQEENRKGEALAAYQNALEQDPSNLEARLLLDRLNGRAVASEPVNQDD